jgi:hypothetical protein
MWRLFSYWRIEEKDGGVYVQNESVSLTRTVPALLAFIVNPLVKSIPRNVLVHLLTDTRNAVERAAAVPVTEPAKTDKTGGWQRAKIGLGGFAWLEVTALSRRRGLARRVF